MRAKDELSWISINAAIPYKLEKVNNFFLYLNNNSRFQLKRPEYLLISLGVNSSGVHITWLGMLKSFSAILLVSTQIKEMKSYRLQIFERGFLFLKL